MSSRSVSRQRFANEIGARQFRVAHAGRQRENAHAGAFRSLDTQRRVLDRERLGRHDRIALAQQKTQPAQRHGESVGLGLAALDILRRDDIDEQIAQTRRGAKSFRPRRARCP